MQAWQRRGKLRRPTNEDGEGEDVDMEACFVGGVESSEGNDSVDSVLTPFRVIKAKGQSSTPCYIILRWE